MSDSRLFSLGLHMLATAGCHLFDTASIVVCARTTTPHAPAPLPTPYSPGPGPAPRPPPAMMTMTRSSRPRLAPLLTALPLALALMAAALTVASSARADPRDPGSTRTLLDSAADAALSDAALPLTAGSRASPRVFSSSETGTARPVRERERERQTGSRPRAYGGGTRLSPCPSRV